LKTAHSVPIILHNCRPQHSTERFW